MINGNEWFIWEAGNVDESNPVENPEDWIWREDIGTWERK